MPTEGGQSITKFLAGMKATSGSSSLQCDSDLRYDDGGDYVNTYRFARHLPKLIPPAGRIFVLTGPATFSREYLPRLLVKHAGKGRVLFWRTRRRSPAVFSEEVGHVCRTTHCVSRSRLANMIISMLVRIGCLFLADYLFQFPSRFARPDEVIPLSFKDWRAGVDLCSSGPSRWRWQVRPVSGPNTTIDLHKRQS